jgi:dTDP-4-amino-4,6-dideoxygalactose transaminase
MNISFLNLPQQYTAIQEEIESKIKEAISSFIFCRGPHVADFEALFAKLISSQNCISTGNGTDSLYIALKNLGVDSSDEVITPSMSWISSAETISQCGAKPVFADVEPLYYTIDPDSVKRNITRKTKGIIVVHLYGQAADLTAICSLCEQHNLFLIEDCSQAHFSEYQGRCVGTYGNLGTFSFYPTKNLGAYGDAGCIITDASDLAEKVRRFSNHGALQKDDHLIEGINSRMDTIQAAVLLAKMPYVQEWNQKRIQNARLYTDFLQGIDEVITPVVRPETKHTFHIYAIRAQRRDALKEYLEMQKIQTIIHYPKALPNLPAYRHQKHKLNDFPVATLLQNEVLSLPIYPELKEEEIAFVCEKIKAFYQK